MRRCAGKAHINEHKSAAQLKRLSTKKVVKDTEWDNDTLKYELYRVGDLPLVA